jgi:hypothetical protein
MSSTRSNSASDPSKLKLIELFKQPKSGTAQDETTLLNNNNNNNAINNNNNNSSSGSLSLMNPDESTTSDKESLIKANNLHQQRLNEVLNGELGSKDNNIADAKKEFLTNLFLVAPYWKYQHFL